MCAYLRGGNVMNVVLFYGVINLAAQVPALLYLQML